MGEESGQDQQAPVWVAEEAAVGLAPCPALASAASGLLVHCFSSSTLPPCLVGILQYPVLILRSKVEDYVSPGGRQTALIWESPEPSSPVSFLFHLQWP